MSDAPNPPQVPQDARDSLLAPLALPAFRAIWAANIVSNIGTLMQSVGAAWLMTSLTSSTTLVGLVQTAATLPVFLVGLLAGALADLVDRKALLFWSQAWMLLMAALLGVLTLLGYASPWVLLALTFGLGAWRCDQPSGLAGHRTGHGAQSLGGVRRFAEQHFL